MMERNDYIEDDLFPFYALDALTDEEKAEVEAYIAANPEARARLRETVASAAALATLAEPLSPSPEVKARLMARVTADAAPLAAVPAEAAESRASSPARPRFDLSRFFLGRALAFAVLLLLLGGFSLWRLWQQTGELQTQLAALEQRADALQAELDRQESVNTMLLEELAGRDQVLAQLGQPGAASFAIGDPSGTYPAAAGIVTASPAGEGVALTVLNLPPPQPGMTYQAWLIVDGAAVSGGTFAVDATGRGIHRIAAAQPGSYDAVGVSLEPSGGSAQPTPDQIILLGPEA